MAAHGVIHAMGVALLWQLGEPGTLRCADAVPEPGGVAGIVAGGGWAVAGLLFLGAAMLLLLRRDGWPRIAVMGAAVSLPWLLLMVASAPVGLAVDVLVLLVGGWMLRTRRAGTDR
jgi:hypothetical protein